MNGKKLMLTIPGIPLTAAALLIARVFYQAHRPDLPEHPNQDPSGTFGSGSLPPLRMVVLGDSSITAPGLEDLNNCWIRAAARHFTDRYQVELINLAVGGSKARDVLTQQLPLALALQPELAVIAVGGNDSLRTVRLSRYERELREIVAALHDTARAVVMLGVGDLGEVPRLPRILAPALSWRARRTDRVVTRVADGFPRAVRIETWGTLSASFEAFGLAMWGDDLFHLSDFGHTTLFGDVLPALDEAATYLGSDAAAHVTP